MWRSINKYTPDAVSGHSARPGQTAVAEETELKVPALWNQGAGLDHG